VTHKNKTLGNSCNKHWQNCVQSTMWWFFIGSATRWCRMSEFVRLWSCAP